jgi:hypothetical protein
LTGARSPIAVGALALVLAVALAACGSSDKKQSSTSAASSSSSSGNGGLTVSITEAGKTPKITAPKSAKGGLTTLRVTNKGKQPHAAQLLQVKGNHTTQDIAKAFGPNNHSANEWLRAEGGVGRVAPGQTATATLVLPAGHYFVADTSVQNGPPAFSELKVTGGESGSLPSASTTVTAANPGKDRYRWDLSGPLKSGASTVKFVSKGKKALHFIQAVRVIGSPSKQQVLKTLESEGKSKGPKVIDEQTFYDTAVLDGGKEQITPLVLSKPGRWLLFCALNDRGEPKPHFKEGLVKFVTVK